MLAHRLQRVGVEEAISFERDAADETVIQGTLQHVVVFRFAMQQEEAVVDVDVANGGTRLAVGAHVRQFVVLAEGLAAGCGADAAGDV